ncbi:MAG: hypothetical protein P1U39_04550 [Legionellaceae bacterium]|nr:hypothetical protein [Legionellaceae bacterium]
MDNKKKKELLVKEFKGILTKAQGICKAYNDQFDASNTEENFVQVRSQQLSDLIESFINSFEIPIEQEKLSAFQDKLNIIFENSEEYTQDMTESELKHHMKDVVSDKSSVLERILMDLTRVVRHVFEILGKVSGFMTLHKDNLNLGETRFALRVTGHSQFFPRPMKSLIDARFALDDISTRLNECIEQNKKNDDEEDDELSRDNPSV